MHKIFQDTGWGRLAPDIKKIAAKKSGAAKKSFFVFALFFFAAFFLSAQAESQGGIVPESIRRPDFNVDPVYPRDVSIGALGRGSAQPEAYNYSRRVLTDLWQAKKTSELLTTIPSKIVDNIVITIEKTAPGKFRVGGGKEGVDGSVSFVFRFIGREEELSGAIYLREQKDGTWKLEDIIFDEPRGLEEAKQNDNPYLWLPYDRFY